MSKRNGPIPEEVKTGTGISEAEGPAAEIARLKAELEQERVKGQRFRVAAESATNLIYEWDLGSRVEWLGQVDELLGYQPDEFPRTWEGYKSLFHSEDRDRILAAIEKQLKAEEPYSVECRVRRKDGTYLHWQDRGTVVRDESGKPVKWIGAVTDITNRKRTEEALAASEEKFRKAFTTSPDSISINRISDGLYVSINTGFTKIMGYSEKEIIGRTSIEMNIWDDPADRRRLVAGLQKDGVVENLEARFRAMNGDLKYGLMSAALIEIDRLPHVLSITRDITERRRAEQALRESELKFRGIFENVQDLYYETTIDGTILEVSPSIEILSKGQYRRDDLLGRNITDFYSESGDRPVLLEILKERGRITDHEITLKSRDGSLIICSLSAEIRPDAQGRPEKIVGSMLNITERKRAEEAIRVSLQEKEVLLREIHHRVKNNLQVISSLFNLQAGHTLNEGCRAILKAAQTRIRSISLIHERLYQSGQLSRIDFGGYLNSLAVHLIHVYCPQPGRIRLETDFEDMTLDIASAIPCGLLLNELISNALKHAFPENRGGIVRIGLKHEPDGLIEIRVADNGIGFPENLDFRNARSFGLQIVSLLGGQLDATIELDRTSGTAFTAIFRELKYPSRA
jgi:PAS domain S-box-containing protein